MTLERESVNWVKRGAKGMSPQLVPMMMPNSAVGYIAMRYGLRGPSFSVSSACATGTHALGEAARMIERGDADVVVAGGTEAPITAMVLDAFRRISALSTGGVSRPFDARRDGFVMGEGAGIMVLESVEHARRRGAKQFGAIIGYGASNDAFHITQPDEDGSGARQAMQQAIADAGLEFSAIGYINAHGTATAHNDRVESAVIRSLADGDSPPPVSSTKSAIGHLLGAAGAVEAIATQVALERGVLPPTINYQEPDPDCDLDYITSGARPVADVRYALSNSFGFGGQNACVVLAAGE
jgi:3-oxoacyl-[acyl-carrier-protein] synthase II